MPLGIAPHREYIDPQPGTAGIVNYSALPAADSLLHPFYGSAITVESLPGVTVPQNPILLFLNLLLAQARACAFLHPN
jgi:hypothetical protein